MRPEPGAVAFLTRLAGRRASHEGAGDSSEVDEASTGCGLPVCPLVNAFGVEAFQMMIEIWSALVEDRDVT
jgi:hypothetical protein